MLRLYATSAGTGIFKVPEVHNEPFLHYPPGSPERKALREAIHRLKGECPDIPCIVGGKEIRTGIVEAQTMPTDHQHKLCTYHNATPEVIQEAIENALEAKRDWERWPFEERATVYLKAADLLSTKYRAELCAAVMLGQGKNVWQAEIDASVETIDFWRFSAKFAQDLMAQQPTENAFGVWNRQEYRALEGFVAAITPFNFIAIASNLHSSPSIMGNTCLWKPSPTSILGCWVIYKILKEAGLPDGVLNFLPADGPLFGDAIFQHPDLAGVHFTGSTDTFAVIWRAIADNLRPYNSYPRVVGETGGKNFHFVHSSADVESVIFNTIRSAFEYQGQKCSAASRLYAPADLWPQIKEGLVENIKKIKVGPVEEFDSFMCAVIDEASFRRIASYIDLAKASDDYEVIAGGGYDDSKGWFVEPTVIVTTDPNSKLMTDEIFGPVLTVYVYEPEAFEATLTLCDHTSKYALTGAVFARDRSALMTASDHLRYSAGNFYINDKSTGSIVAQQPFGGGRGSGTNDKSGSVINLLRWTSIRTVKENFLPCTDFTYPHMAPED
jgi:1-pyrroline-5-carboxylate dehydrogenase